MTASLTLKSPRFEIGARLTGQVKPVAELSGRERDQMYALLDNYFANTTWRRFERDLVEKEWAILLYDVATGGVQGFSTLMRLNLAIGGEPAVVFFSGDTIIHREYWGETALPRLWGRHVFSLAERLRETRVYWFLICSGYKTYRYLPLFFREFYPNCERATPAPVKEALDRLGWLKFGGEYDPERGVIRFRQAEPLQSGVAEITPQRLKDPHVAFFVQANPGHAQGDELACLAELSRGNLRPAGARMVGPLENMEERIRNRRK
ncbi:MAG TPA: hypothetical protein VJ810_39430 [Blastocatellia bacterium]|nr:hypothetical protein [Blastocatellia bacterium]